MAGKLTLTVLLISVVSGFFFGEPVPVATVGDDIPENSWQHKPIDNYLGYENCRKCHQQQVDKLVTTEHFKSFETTHRSDKAKAFCQALGIRSIKRDARCIRCHYTPEKSTRGVRAQSGISCESCHGPSKPWIQQHNDYGGLTVTKAQESVAHRQARIKSSIDSGMRHPSNLYLLARSCYECHLVDDAQLVNATDHPAVSAQFNMLAWSQGSMRHNFLRTNYSSNAESTPPRLRVMFVADLMARTEAILLALVASEPDSKHFNFMQQQYIDTSKQLLAIAKAVNNSAITAVIEILKQTPPTANNEQRKTAATSIRKLAFEFGKNESAHQLEPIQAMLPTPDQYR